MSGNQRMTVSREEAQELFDYLLGFASKFQTSKQALPVSMG
ncbi:MAG TPA: hypothetical protein VFA41_21115 [Ktedonobacteraceae bacterium]|nr:hypothetical protein [Ktedonobacteraceae bacterium]